MDHQRTADHWDQQHFAEAFLRAEWSFHPLAKKRLHKLLGGVESREQWFHKKYLNGRRNLKALGIGVGKCQSELHLLSMGAISQYDLYDVSPVALGAGRETAERFGIADKAEFICKDIHTVDLEPDSYDLITFFASLHHIEDLNAILSRCEKALAPGGVLWAAEYIGPDYFQYPDEDADFARRFYRAIDPDLKKAWEPELRWCTKEELITDDPTESVHSSDIPDVMKRIFDKVEIIPTYGTFVFILSWCLNHDAFYDTEKGQEFFQTILDIDTALLDAGKLPHYFAYLIAHKDTLVSAFARSVGLDPSSRIYQGVRRFVGKGQ